MVRVTLISPEGMHVEVRTDAGYSPDVAEDCANRARELMASALRDHAHLVTDLGEQ